MAQELEEKRFVFNSKNVEEITDKINDGVVIKRYQNPWFENQLGVRRTGITFAWTDEEIQEWVKCAKDIYYFAEKYCKVKTEEGNITNIKLRDYQYKILDLYTKNRFSILMGSRQIGKCVTFNSLVDLESGEKVRIGILYYTIQSMERKITFLEKLKISLYNILFRFNI
jgi:hypothetical protein